MTPQQRKQGCRDVFSVHKSTPSYLDWSEDTISFSREDHPDYIPNPGRYPLVVDPIIGKMRFSKVLMDGGSSLNIMYAHILELMGIGFDEGTTPSDTTIDYKVSLFQINLSSRFENKLLPNDLIIVRNHGDDEEDVGKELGGMVDQQGQPSRVGGPIQVKFESDSESRSSSYQNQRPCCIRSPFWMFFIWMER